jgi:hypothetical protein
MKSKNKSTHSGSGKHWGSLTASRKSEYAQHSSGGSGGGSPSSQFIGPTKGNKDLPTNRSS